MKAALGHDGPPQNYWRENLITGRPLERCPLRSLQLARETDPAESAELDRYIDVYYPAYKRGFLLEGGGIGDQPARYMALIHRIEEVDDLVELKYAELTAKTES